MPEITKTKGQKPKTKTNLVWLFFLLVVVGFYFFGLTIPLVGPDEPRYAQVAREMFERGDWITPTLGGSNWFEKPALLYWLEIVSYKIFGVSEFAARFGSAVFGLGTIFSLWVLGKFAATESTEEAGQTSKAKDQKSKISFANLLALIAASTIGIIVFSRGASFDVILTLPITASLVSFFIFDNSKDKKFISQYLPLISFYFFIGISLLAKGLIGIVFPFAIVGFYYLLSRKWPNRTFIFSLFWGTLLALAVACTWYLPMYERHGYAFIDEFFIQHHFQRFTSNKYQHPQPFYFFFWVLPLMTIPWLPFFLASIWNLFKGSFYHRDTETQRESFIRNTEAEAIRKSTFLPFPFSPLLLFSISWLVVPLIFFSFSGSKLPGYILPAVPAAIVLTADYVWRFTQSGRSRVAAIQIVAMSVFATAVLLLIFVVPRFADADSVKGLIETANERGFSKNRVLSMHTVSHNAEFYAAGRLLRDESGKQRKLLGPTDVLQEIKSENGNTVLVLIPLEYLTQLTQTDYLKADVLKNNGELAIVAVTAR